MGALSIAGDQLRASVGIGPSTPGAARPGDARSESRRDRDRVLYSPSFARLGGVTQVITPSPIGRLTHNRMTHTLKVAQLSRSIAELVGNPNGHHAAAVAAFGGVDAEVAEAAALAHDIGHPPFGHIGEKILDGYAKSVGLHSGFEGNAQSFRIVTVLDVRDFDGRGLSLTYATLAAILKYPWTRGYGDELTGVPVEDPFYEPFRELTREKFGCYALEREREYDESWDTFAQVFELIPRDEFDRPLQTPEAAIMDVADDITYALHDLDDFLQSRLISKAAILGVLDDWLIAAVESSNSSARLPHRPDTSVLGKHERKLRQTYPERFQKADMLEAVGALREVLDTALPAEHTGHTPAALSIQTMVSALITQFLGNLEVSATARRDFPYVRLAPVDWHIVEVLKAITRHLVIERAGLAAVQRGQQHLLLQLTQQVAAWIEKDEARAPTRLLQSLSGARELELPEPQARARAAVDYVAGLSDLQAIELHRVLHGGHVDLAGHLVH